MHEAGQQQQQQRWPGGLLGSVTPGLQGPPPPRNNTTGDPPPGSHHTQIPGSLPTLGPSPLSPRPDNALSLQSHTTSSKLLSISHKHLRMDQVCGHLEEQEEE